MEPLSDRELDEVMARWKAPKVPVTLEERVRRGRRSGWWTWLLRGSIRVPVPASLMVVAAFVVLVVLAARHGSPVHVRQETSLSAFQPVKRLEPRIIRSSYGSYESNY